MASKTKLIQIGFTEIQAKHLGNDYIDNLTATGDSQSNAYQLITEVNYFNVVDIGTGAILPKLESYAQDILYLKNDGDNDILVYPFFGEEIDSLGIDTAITIKKQETGAFVKLSELKWMSFIASVGGGGGAGTVTNVGAGNGMDFSSITTTGDVTLGTPSEITSSTSNSVSGTTHTHSLNNTGVAANTYTYATVTVDTKGRVTNASSNTPPAATPAGSNTEIQYNNSGAFGASPNIRIGNLYLNPSVIPSGSETKLLWYPGKYAFRAGAVTNNYWDDANIGSYSTAFGSNCKASNSYAFATGASSEATGVASLAFGTFSIASAAYGIAMGFQSNATTGASPVAIGYQANATANYALAFGRVTASGIEALAMGSSQTVASGRNSAAFGRYSRAIGDYSISIAQNIAGQSTSGRAGTLTTHNGAIIIGSATKANALNASEIGAIVIGTDANATGKYSVALGVDFTNSLDNSFAVGFAKKGFEINQVRNAEVCVNGDFSSSTNWTIPAGWAYDSTNFEADKNANGTNALEHNATVTVGEVYYVTYQVKNWTTGTVIMSLGGVTTASVGSNNILQYYITPTNTNPIKFTPTNTSRFSITNVSIKALSHDMLIYGKMKTLLGYQSIDGTDGTSATIDLTNTSEITVKDGLVTAVTTGSPAWGDVTGPASSVANSLVSYADVSGKEIEDLGIWKLDNSGGNADLYPSTSGISNLGQSTKYLANIFSNLFAMGMSDITKNTTSTISINSATTKIINYYTGSPGGTWNIDLLNSYPYGLVVVVNNTDESAAVYIEGDDKSYSVATGYALVALHVHTGATTDKWLLNTWALRTGTL